MRDQEVPLFAGEVLPARAFSDRGEGLRASTEPGASRLSRRSSSGTRSFLRSKLLRQGLFSMSYATLKVQLPELDDDGEPSASP